MNGDVIEAAVVNHRAFGTIFLSNEKHGCCGGAVGGAVADHAGGEHAI